MKPIPTTQRLLRFSRRTAVRYCALGVAVFMIGYLATYSLRGDNSMATNSLPQEEITALRPVAAVLMKVRILLLMQLKHRLKESPALRSNSGRRSSLMKPTVGQ